ncbi:TonB-dependent receptor [Lysobacter niastensis]|uniref:TonB-dependent receptor n=1 Tax=Lysobacter niastensis TaxID=380629 RepID=A0ABS0BBG6_9GAMM|nr:TonB-dependent receptor [Lysobacter niastensis]MBF6025017.1 TonB-dependent receptor [Lysobacter niastensis]
MRKAVLRRAALCIALGACIGAMSPVMAQSATGAVAGRATAGDRIVLTNTATGMTRNITVDADGSYRLAQLPVGDYSLQVVRDGQDVGSGVAVNVALGGTTTVNLGAAGNVVNLESVQVVGQAVVNRVDVRSTESATNVTREEIARLPVDQNLESVAELAPGVNVGNASFGGLSFGGASVAENAVYINGLNVTDFYTRQGFSTAPFAFYKEFQVKTGGYSVEFGRSTGGVINTVTRSGSNELEGGVEVTFEPAAMRSSADDHFHPDGSVHAYASHDTQQFTKANVWASGPLVKDRLFMFAMYEQRQNDKGYTNNLGNQWTDSYASDGFWGTKLDWRISDNHLLEVLAFSDAGDAKLTTYNYNFATSDVGLSQGDSFADSGGDNWSVTYTGWLAENFVAKAMYGINNRSSFTRSQLDEQCSRVTIDSSYNARWIALGRPVVGCHPTGNAVIERDDEREASRLDFEWTLGEHLLRFGFDRELMTTDQTNFYPGPEGKIYTALGVRPGQLLWEDVAVPAGVTEVIRGRRRSQGGVFETEATAFYVEDVWNVTPNFLLTLGLRWDQFDNRDAGGNSFIKDDMVAPRGGFSWDVKGDGTTKVYGNLGRYYMPVTNNVNATIAGGLIDEYTYYVLNGWNQQANPVTGAPYSAPILGAQIGPVDDRLNLSTADLRKSVDRDLEAVYQDEMLLGYQAMLNDAWSWGVNGTYRRVERALDDIRINHTPCGPTATLFPIGNPGESLTIWGDASMGCATPGWITIDTSKDGYRKGGSNEVIGYSDPERTYKALEFQIDRAWDGKWAFNASYLWSKSEGNFEGPVNSDTGYGDTGIVQHWDHPAANERYGVLFNDHRHQFKFRGSYALSEQWTVGANLQVLSGGPITAFGTTWPNDTLGAGSFTNEASGGGSGWICVDKCTGNNPATGRPYTYADRVYEYSPRGAFGELPWTWELGANVTWTLPVEGVDLKVRFSVFNLTNNQETVNIHARYEGQPGDYRNGEPMWNGAPSTLANTFNTGTRWQSPRYAQLVVSWQF